MGSADYDYVTISSCVIVVSVKCQLALYCPVESKQAVDWQVVVALLHWFYVVQTSFINTTHMAVCAKQNLDNNKQVKIPRL